MKVAVIGTGIAGKGIAQVCASKGFCTIFKSRTQEALEQAIQKIDQSLTKINPEQKTQARNNIKLTTTLDDLREADLIIEAIIEDVDFKKQFLQSLSAFLSPETIVATNTSSLSIDDLASVVPTPEKFIGIHFFNPVPKMQLVEIVKGTKTGDATTAQVENFIKKLDKTPILVKDSPCFIVNRIMATSLNEAAWELYEGVASATDIDSAITLGLNHPMGPLALMDLIGLDTMLSIMENLHQATNNQKYAPCPLLKQMVDEGKLGRKTKRGFYEYKR